MPESKEKADDVRTEIARVTLVQLVCPGCGIAFAVAKEMADDRQLEGGMIICPNGHPLVLNEEATQRKMQEAQAAAQAEKTVQRLVVPRRDVDPRSLRTNGPQEGPGP